ncbi:MAG: Xaa-Pro peptidase family protein [Bacteroidetes bacterium]|nr:Xaa-Pro peptidase family protein [Bacteroidota bacterium]
MLVKEKIKQAISILKERNIDCWITFVRESAINHDPMLDFLVETDLTWHSALIITSKGDAIAIVGQGDVANVQDLGVYTEIHSYVKGIQEHFKDVLKKLNPSKIALNYSIDSEISDGLTHGMYQIIYSMLKDIKLHNNIISAEDIISSLRGRKSLTEIANIKEAIKHTIEIFDLATDFIKPGLTEKQIARFMKEKAKERGLELSWDEKYCPGVFTGPNTNVAHYSPTDRKVEKGHILNMDFGVKVNGYCSDLQRTWYILKDNESVPPKDVVRGFNTVKESIELAKEVMCPGIQGKNVDFAARWHVMSNGYEEFKHGVGHQVGMFPHDGYALLGPEWEKYGSKVLVPLEKDMVFTIEPKLFVEGKGIATIEEMFVITEDGAEYLSKPQEELYLIK